MTEKIFVNTRSLPDPDLVLTDFSVQFGFASSPFNRSRLFSRVSCRLHVAEGLEVRMPNPKKRLDTVSEKTCLLNSLSRTNER